MFNVFMAAAQKAVGDGDVRRKSSQIQIQESGRVRLQNSQISDERAQPSHAPPTVRVLVRPKEFPVDLTQH